MPLPARILGADACDLARDWILDVRVPVLLQLVLSAALVNGRNALREDELAALAQATIISGWRSEDQQAALEQAGRPAAPDHLSTHRSCPATGVDIRIENAGPEVWRVVGGAAEAAGMRWGGGSPRKDGIPVDFNHFDLGPRKR